MDIPYSLLSGTDFRSPKKYKGIKREKGQATSAVLEQPFCPKKTHPDYYNLIKHDWAIFGSLTWTKTSCRNDNQTSTKKRFSDFYFLLKQLSKAYSELDQDKIEFFVNSERGSAEECHLHFLISKNGLQGIPPKSIAITLQLLWTTILKKGTARIEPFDNTRKSKGVSYLCKIEYDSNGNPYPSAFKMSIALVKHITRKTAEACKPNEQQHTSGSSTDKLSLEIDLVTTLNYSSFAVSFISNLIAKQRRRRFKGLFRERDPPNDYIQNWKYS